MISSQHGPPVNTNVPISSSHIQILGRGSLSKVERIAEGTYGIVYTATSGNREFAVKRMKTTKNVMFISSLRELDFLARYKHPFMISLVGVSRNSPFGLNQIDTPNRSIEIIDDKIYLIFNKAAYDSNYLLQYADFSYLKLAMIQVLLGLEYMHGHGSIHRDIKPGNLLWFRYGKERVLTICDFGISKMCTSQEKNSCVAVTPLYRAPEMLYGFNTYSYRSDVWSLGCVFYQFISKNSFLEVDKSVDYGKRETYETKTIKEIFAKLPEIPTGELLKKYQMQRKIAFSRSTLNKQYKTWTKFVGLNQEQINRFNTGATYATYDNFCNLLSNMMKIDHTGRYTATQCIDHQFFADYRHYINQIRTMYPPHDIDHFNIPVDIIQCDERTRAIKIAFSYFNNRPSYKWYHHRIIFNSIDIFDRYIVHHKNRPDTYALNNDTVDFYYTVCLYISIKYHLTLLEPPKFTDFVSSSFSTPDCLKIAEDFEWYLLSTVFNFKIYRPTVYETADFYGILLDERQTLDLLKIYANYTTISCKLFTLFELCSGLINLRLPTYSNKNQNVNQGNIVNNMNQGNTMNHSNTNIIYTNTTVPNNRNPSNVVNVTVPTSNPEIRNVRGVATNITTYNNAAGYQTMKGYTGHPNIKIK